MTNTSAVIIIIGNNDNKLTQRQWSEFIKATDHTLRTAATPQRVHGQWFSAPDSPYQNAAWCIELPEGTLPTLQTLYILLAGLARRFLQESIAVVVNQPRLVPAAASPVYSHVPLETPGN